MQTILAKNKYGDGIILYWQGQVWYLLKFLTHQNIKEIKIPILF